ncbi:hypothetical protein ACLOJK_027949 [Asimina triloba]
MTVSAEETEGKKSKRKTAFLSFSMKKSHQAHLIPPARKEDSLIKAFKRAPFIRRSGEKRYPKKEQKRNQSEDGRKGKGEFVGIFRRIRFVTNQKQTQRKMEIAAVAKSLTRRT